MPLSMASRDNWTVREVAKPFDALAAGVVLLSTDSRKAATALRVGLKSASLILCPEAPVKAMVAPVTASAPAGVA